MHDGLSERFHEKHKQLREAQREVRRLRSDNTKLRLAARASFWRAAFGVLALAVVLGVAAVVINARLEELHDVCTYHAVVETTDPEPVAVQSRESAILIVQRSGYDTPGEVF
jgi:anti-sigma-K factor RskA